MQHYSQPLLAFGLAVGLTFATREAPAQELTEAPGRGSARIEEALPVEVIAWRAVVIEPAFRGAGARRGAEQRQRSDQFCEPSAG